MRRDDVITRLKEAEPALRKFGVAALYLFGSHARDEASPNSDVDVFIDPASDRPFGFLPFMDATRPFSTRLALTWTMARATGCIRSCGLTSSG
jgi:predicted nucleotidyltransferase